MRSCSSLLPLVLIIGLLTSMKTWWFSRPALQLGYSPSNLTCEHSRWNHKSACPCIVWIRSTEEWNVVFQLECSKIVQRGFYLADEPFWRLKTVEIYLLSWPTRIISPATAVHHPACGCCWQKAGRRLNWDLVWSTRGVLSALWDSGKRAQLWLGIYLAELAFGSTCTKARKCWKARWQGVWLWPRKGHS